MKRSLWTKESMYHTYFSLVQRERFTSQGRWPGVHVCTHQTTSPAHARSDGISFISLRKGWPCHSEVGMELSMNSNDIYTFPMYKYSHPWAASHGAKLWGMTLQKGAPLVCSIKIWILQQREQSRSCFPSFHGKNLFGVYRHTHTETAG